MINTREQITDLLNYNSVGCELGIFEGEFSQILVNSNKFDKLYLVDTFSGKAYNFGKEYEDASVLENKAKNRFESYPVIEVIKNDSLSFLKSMPNNSFDFIYIDTIHSYEQTIIELEEAYRTIKNSGLICGHDYCLQFSGVIRAVTEFCEKYMHKILVTQEKDYPSFILTVLKTNE